MSGTVKFNRDVAEWGAQVKNWEKADDVGHVISEILCSYYPVGALMDAKISGNWLGEGEKPANSPETLDLMLQMRGPDGVDYVELILRSTSYAPYYASYLVGAEVEITDDLVNGHRVLISSDGSFKYRYEFDGYDYVRVATLTLSGQPTNSTAAWRTGTLRGKRGKAAA